MYRLLASPPRPQGQPLRTRRAGKLKSTERRFIPSWSGDSAARWEVVSAWLAGDSARESSVPAADRPDAACPAQAAGRGDSGSRLDPDSSAGLVSRRWA